MKITAKFLITCCVWLVLQSCTTISYASDGVVKPDGASVQIDYNLLPWKLPVGRVSTDPRVDTALSEAATFARQGKFVLAQKKLMELEKLQLSRRDQLRRLLAMREVEVQRHSLFGGGMSVTGDIIASWPDFLYTMKKSDQYFTVLSSELSQQESNVSKIDVRIEKFIKDLGFAFPIQVSRHIFSGLQATEGLKVNEYLQGLLDVDTTSLTTADREVVSLLRFLGEGRLASAMGESDKALDSFQKGAMVAKEAKWPEAEADFWLRRGDARIAPFGSVETLGFDLFSVGFTITSLRAGLVPEVFFSSLR